jgi:hypothetical protein
MSSDSMFDLSALAVESISVVPAESVEHLAGGHGMTELAGSCQPPCGWCWSTPSFITEDDI